MRGKRGIGCLLLALCLLFAQSGCGRMEESGGEEAGEEKRSRSG